MLSPTYLNKFFRGVVLILEICILLLCIFSLALRSAFCDIGTACWIPYGFSEFLNTKRFFNVLLLAFGYTPCPDSMFDVTLSKINAHGIICLKDIVGS